MIIPALNEEKAIPLVLADLPAALVRHILVCDNGSRDRTAEVARQAGARVIHAPRRGYGSACLAGIAWLKDLPLAEQPDILVFLDGDHADYPEELPLLLSPILENHADLVIGSRVTGRAERGALQPQQRFGNALATTLIRWIYGVHFTDLGPFRAIRWSALPALNMRDPDYGWTVEMQVRAAKSGLRCTEAPVSYRARVGQSKVSGTLRGSIMAGYKILWTIFRNI